MSEPFSGHDIEAGLLQRVRSWRDLFPPLGLIPALRVAGSPLHVLMWLGWLILIQCLLVQFTDIPFPKLQWLSLRSAEASLETSSLADQLVTISIRDWVILGIIELLSIFPAAISMRAGALYTAGRDGEGFGDTVKLTLNRWKTLLQVSLLPWVCILGLALPLLLVAAASRIPTVGRAIAESLGLLVSPLLLVIGILAAGAMFAIPLALASTAVEKRDDGFDALSRGYEYVLRRPVQTVVYFISSLLLMLLVGAIFTLISIAAISVAGTALSLVNDHLAMLSVWEMIFTTLPLAAVATTKTALFGAMYLLLRYDANSQEIEQIETSASDRKKPSLPTL